MVARLGKNPDHPDGAPPPAVDSAGVYLGVSLEDLNYGQLRRKGECELGASSEPTGLRRRLADFPRAPSGASSQRCRPTGSQRACVQSQRTV